MKILRRILFLGVGALVILSFGTLHAERFPDGGGIVYGDGYAFNLKAPKGWTLDNSAGVSQRLNAVFYPNGSNWSDSPIVAYAQSRPKTPAIQTPEDAVKDTIKRFHADGNSPNYQGTKLKTLKANGGAEAVLYQFSGDQWGNYEVAAYFAEKDRINFLVMNSRDKKLFDQNMPAFEELAKSYLPMTASVTSPSKK